MNDVYKELLLRIYRVLYYLDEGERCILFLMFMVNL